MKTFYVLAVIFVATLAQTISAGKIPQPSYDANLSHLSNDFGYGQKQGVYLTNVERCVLNQLYTPESGNAGQAILDCAKGNRYDISNKFS